MLKLLVAVEISSQTKGQMKFKEKIINTNIVYALSFFCIKYEKVCFYYNISYLKAFNLNKKLK